MRAPGEEEENMDYTTQMDAARKGILTEELKRVAEKELFEPAELMRLVAEGCHSCQPAAYLSGAKWNRIQA